jgi:hypothetical protein
MCFSRNGAAATLVAVALCLAFGSSTAGADAAPSSVGVAGRRVQLAEATQHRLDVIALDRTAFQAFAFDPATQSATLRVQVVNADASDSSDQTFPLPASGWRVSGAAADPALYQYRDIRQVNGPIRNLSVEPHAGVLRLRAASSTGALTFSLASHPTVVNVVLTVGATSYCMSFGGVSYYRPNHTFVSILAPRPASCMS